MTQLIEGWNLVSSGGYKNSFSELAGIDASNISLVYNGSHEIINIDDSLEQGIAYWVLCSSPVTLSVELGKVDDITIDISSGWNLVSTPRSSSMTLTDMLGENADTITCIAKYDGTSYQSVSTDSILEPGVGYWMLSTRTYTVELTWQFVASQSELTIDADNNIPFNFGKNVELSKNYLLVECELKNFDTLEDNDDEYGLASYSLEDLSRTVRNKWGYNSNKSYSVNKGDDFFALTTTASGGRTMLKNISNQSTIGIGSSDTSEGVAVSCARDSDNPRIAVSNNSDVIIYDYNDSLFSWSTSHTINVINGESIKMTPDGNTIAIISTNDIVVYDISDSKTQLGNDINDHELSNHKNVAISGDGRKIILTDNQNDVYTYYYNDFIDDWNIFGEFQVTGYNVDIDADGSTVIVGSPDENRAYIHNWDGYSWNKTMLQGTADENRFGESVSINNNYIAIGSPNKDVVDRTGFPYEDWGKVMLFENKPFVSKDDSVFKNRFNFNFMPQGGSNVEWDIIRKNLVRKGGKQWSEVISSMPGNNVERQIDVECRLRNDSDWGDCIGGCIAGSAGPRDWDDTGFVNQYYRYYTLTGVVSMNSTLSFDSFDAVFGHEIGHVLGIGSFWRSRFFHYSRLKTETLQDDDAPREYREYYQGENALNVYKHFDASVPFTIDGINTNYKNTAFSDAPNFIGIPIEQDGGDGTSGAHIEEGDRLDNDKPTFFQNGKQYCCFKDEIMTGITHGEDILSAITIGLIADLGYGVNWQKSKPYTLDPASNKKISNQKKIRLNCLCNIHNVKVK